MQKLFITFYGIIVLLFVVFSYGFTDVNITLSGWTWYEYIHTYLIGVVKFQRPFSTIVFCGFLLLFFGMYIWVLRTIQAVSTPIQKKIVIILLAISCLLVLAYPAVSYDIFNYISTAKLAFTYHENPYVVMPIEIPHEPFLAFTRAANKTALYGPIWILLTYMPWIFSGGNIWAAIIMFKFMNTLVFLSFAYFIYVVTGSYKNIIFFALNPLVLIEVLVSGHNDIFMMALALSGLWLLRNKKKNIGLGLFIASWFIKGASVMLFPLLFIKKLSWEKILIISFWLLFILFIVVAPLREELYPWYAVWFISIAAMMNLDKHIFIYWFVIVLSFSLELRHLPYMWMGYYEGPGPLLRGLFTAIPILLFFCVHLVSHRHRVRRAL